MLSKYLSKLAWADVRTAFPFVHRRAPADLCDQRIERNVSADGVRLSMLVDPVDAASGPRIGVIFAAAIAPTIALASATLPAVAQAVLLVILALSLLGTDAEDFAKPGGEKGIGVGDAGLLLVAVLLDSSMLFGAPGYLSAIPAILFAIRFLGLPVSYLKARIRKRDALALIGAKACAEDASDAAKQRNVLLAEKDRQAARALADTSPIMPFGIAQGVFAGKGDVFAPDKYLQVAVSADDLATHLFCFGETGTGKTLCVAKPVFEFWAAQKLGGALLLDGKGELPQYFAARNADVTLLAPGATVTFAAIEGLPAEDVTSIIIDVMGGGVSKTDFWTVSAETLIRYAALALEAASAEAGYHGQHGWTLLNLSKMISSKDHRAAVISKARRQLDDDHPSLLTAAVEYLAKDFEALAEDTRSGIQQTASSYLLPIIGHRDLYSWGAATTGYPIETVCQGALVGLSVPDFRYGRAGAAIQALAKARVFNAIKRRGSNWREQDGQTRVLMMVDECQTPGLVGEADNAISAVARSLGMTMVYLSQTLEGVVAQMGDKAALAMLQNYRNLVCFQSSVKTLEWVAGRVGTGPIRVACDSFGVDYQAIAGANSPLVSVGGDDIQAGVYQLKNEQIVSREDLSAWLTQKFAAVVTMVRAGAPRRDICSMRALDG